MRPTLLTDMCMSPILRAQIILTVALAAVVGAAMWLQWPWVVGVALVFMFGVLSGPASKES
jgi:hypothetical protein